MEKGQRKSMSCLASLFWLTLCLLGLYAGLYYALSRAGTYVRFETDRGAKVSLFRFVPSMRGIRYMIGENAFLTVFYPMLLIDSESCSSCHFSLLKNVNGALFLNGRPVGTRIEGTTEWVSRRKRSP